MSKKPTYEELEERVKALEKEAKKRKRLEQKIKESEEKHRSLITNISDVTWTTDYEGKTSFISPNIEKEYGYTPEEVYKGGASIWLGRIHPEDSGKVEKAFKKLFEKGTMFDVEYRIKRKDGKWIWAHDRSIACYERDGVMYADGIFSNITERKQAEEALNAERSRLADLLNFQNEMLTTAAIWIDTLDPEGNVTFWNQAAEAISGYTAEEVIGHGKIWEWLYPDPEYRAEIVERAQAIIHKGEKVENFETRIRLKDGQYRTISWHSNNLFEEGKLVGSIALGADITDRVQAEKTLRESEERYKALSEIAIEGLLLHDKGVVVDANSTFAKMFGYEVKELIGKNVIDSLALPEYRDLVLEKMADGFDKPYEIISQRKDKTTFSLMIEAAREVHYKDRILRVASVRDLSEQRLAEEALRESEEKYKILTEESPLGLALISEEGNYKYFNPKFVEMFGYTLEDIPTGKDWLRRAYPNKEYRNQVISTWVDDLKHATTGETRPRTFIVTCRDNTEKIIHFRPVSLKNGDHIVTYEDITERKQAEEALRESEEKYRFLTENMADIVWTLDRDFQTTYVSPSVEKVLGFTPEERKRQTLEEMVTPESLKRIMETFMEELQRDGEYASPDRSINIEVEYYHRDGSTVWMENSVKAIRDQAGAIVKMYGTSRDITERKQAEEEKARLEAQVQQGQKMEAIGTLAGGIAHDFNNLLMGIQGRVSLMLMDTDTTNPNYGHLKGIEDYVKSAADLTKQLLGFARGGKYEVKPTDLNELIKNQNRMFGRTKKEITIRDKYEKNLWATEVDQGQITQVLLNLYVNAWQSMPGGGDLYIQTENITIDENYIKTFEVKPGKYVKISVTDTGVGMDEATRQRIFDPFFTTKEMGRGTGLGLATVYGIIKNHEGFINVYSEKGKGTTFDIYLPASEKKIIEEKEETRELLKGTETVLLVDDEEMVIDVGQQILKNLGYKVLISRSGIEAIEVYKENRSTIDIVFLDMVMQEMGGGETYDRLKKINPDIKVLLSSGYSLDGEATEILKRGCNGFIQKPYKSKKLSQKIREILGKD